MLKVKSLAQARRLYDQLRKRYFLDAVAPLRIPPFAKDVGWRTDPSSGAMAETNFNADGTVSDIRLSEWLMGSYTVTRSVLLHELTHIRIGEKYSCGAWSPGYWKGARVARGSAWHRETERLVTLGALHL